VLLGRTPRRRIGATKQQQSIWTKKQEALLNFRFGQLRIERHRCRRACKGDNRPSRFRAFSEADRNAGISIESGSAQLRAKLVDLLL
jgi:hypothetical protein